MRFVPPEFSNTYSTNNQSAYYSGLNLCGRWASKRRHPIFLRVGVQVFSHQSGIEYELKPAAFMYSVWVITRPLSYANLIPPLAFTSIGKIHLHHWGVFVTDLTFLDIQVIMQRTRAWEDGETSVGALYDLRRDETVNNVNVVRPFTLAIIRREWPAFSTQYVRKTDMIHEKIELEGRFQSSSAFQLMVFPALRIIKKHPNYELLNNNCQNFVKYLLEALCPGAPIPDTIQCVLERLQDMFTVTNNTISLPGAYPVSWKTSISLKSSATESGETWYTASGETWIMALGVSPGASVYSQSHVQSRFYSAWRSTTSLLQTDKPRFLDDTELPVALKRTGPQVTVSKHRRVWKKLVTVGDVNSGKTDLLTYILPHSKLICA